MAERLDGLSVDAASPGARPRAPQREPQDRAGGGRAQAAVDGCSSTASQTRPSRGDELELTVDSLAHGGNGVAPPRRLRRVRRRRGARRPRARGRRQGQARLRRGARGRGARAVAGPDPAASPITPAHRGRCCPTSASSRSRPSQVREALERIGQPRGLRARADRARRRAVALPQQARVLVRHRPGRRARAAASTRPAAGTRSSPMDDCLLASERSNELREQVLSCARAEGLQRLGPARAARPPAQPRRPRGPPHGRAAGAAGHVAGRDRRRLAASTRCDCDGLFWTQQERLGETTAGRRDRAALGRARSCASGSAGSTS